MSSPTITPSSHPYLPLLLKLKECLSNEDEPVASLANASAFIYNFLNNDNKLNQRCRRQLQSINWFGFYLCRPQICPSTLILGPYGGTAPAVTRIAFGSGVCGTCVTRRSSIIVPCVHEFEGHIACDINSNSEAVIPLIVSGNKGKVIVGVIDIDCLSVGGFSEENDKHGLEDIADMISSSINWSLITDVNECPLVNN